MHSILWVDWVEHADCVLMVAFEENLFETDMVLSCKFTVAPITNAEPEHPSPGDIVAPEINDHQC